MQMRYKFWHHKFENYLCSISVKHSQRKQGCDVNICFIFTGSMNRLYPVSFPGGLLFDNHWLFFFTVAIWTYWLLAEREFIKYVHYRRPTPGWFDACTGTIRWIAFLQNICILFIWQFFFPALSSKTNWGEKWNSNEQADQHLCFQHFEKEDNIVAVRLLSVLANLHCWCLYITIIIIFLEVWESDHRWRGLHVDNLAW